MAALGNLARAKKDLYNSMSDPYRWQFEPMSDPNRSLLVDANKLCDDALLLDKQRTWYSRLLNVKGVVLKKLGQLDAAIATFNQARDFDKTDSSPVINLGSLWALKHDLNKASRWFVLGARMLSDSDTKDEVGCVFLHRNYGALLLHRANAAASEHLATAHDCMSVDVPTLRLQARFCLKLGGCGDRHNALYFATMADDIAGGQSATAKRILSLAYLRDRAFDETVKEATAAIVLGDLETVDHLILARAELGDHLAAGTHLARARESWPDTLNEPGEYTVHAPAGNLWFESANELLALRAEAEVLLNASRH